MPLIFLVIYVIYGSKIPCGVFGSILTLREAREVDNKRMRKRIAESTARSGSANANANANAN